MAKTESPVASTGVLKRVVLGRAFSSSRLEHTLLPKVLALPVFASDPLSSVAYATEESMVVLLAASAGTLHMITPISLAIATLLAIVVVSYRQTVRAYPNGGGAYIVSRENLGPLAGLIAASALLVDYMMTVVVSVVAGVYAITSAAPGLREQRVWLSVAFVVFVTLANLRGTKESGTFFAIPTYGFVLTIVAMIALGFIDCVGGCPATEPVEPAHFVSTAVAPLTLFVILRAFSSGATALTGVEAISNGVQAFRRPQARNAATTLLIMGSISITMFLGISWLAVNVAGVTVSEERTVVAQIAHAIFGGGIGFYLVQFFTAAILILAANTAYQDFPRLSSILSRDGFMPNQFRNRGDRLVFSNGVIGLAIVSCLVIVAFDADLNRLIQLYIVGVFTSFTLSQTGMVRHWLSEGRRGSEAAPEWRRSIVINVIGAVTTGIVLVVVTATKFAGGAWLSITAMAVLVPVLWSIHRHYADVRRQLGSGNVRSGEVGRNHVVLLVRDFDVATAEAVGYLRSFRPEDVTPVFPCREREVQAEVQARWRAFVGPGIPDLKPIAAGHLTAGIHRVVGTIDRGPDDFVTVVVPELLRPQGLFSYLVRSRDLVRLKASMLRVPNVVVTDVPFVLDEGSPSGAGGKPLIPRRTVTLVFLSSVSDVSVRAVNYARAIDASVTRAVYFDLDPEAPLEVGADWLDIVEGVPLDIVEAPFRDLSIPMVEEVRRYTERPDTIVNVVIPEYIVARWWQLPLHGQTALFVKRLFLFEERVLLTSVAYQLETARKLDREPAE
ncbi:MAG TPA: APC family permease [Actinomycetota bacterium]|nr:APC family permease [Actinomycetota bacterium]